jgi:hypothetical protein
MSLARLALRLAALEALRPSATTASGPWPTIAGGNVFDSSIDPLSAATTPAEYETALDRLDNNPVVTVYTEEDDLHPYSQKYPADEFVVTLVVELMIAARGVVQIDQGPDKPPIEVGALESPITDRQHEALLDMLDSQVRFVLEPRRHAPSAAAFCAIAMETRMVHSDPQRSHDRAVRLASRTVKFHLKIRKEDWSAVGASGLAALPDPLRAFAQGLPPGSALDACVKIAGLVAPPPVPPPGPTSVIISAGLAGRLPTGPADADAVGQI